MFINQSWLDEYQSCQSRINDSNFAEFLEYKKFFKLIYEAANNLDAKDYKEFCRVAGINPLQAINYYTTYEKLFHPAIIEYKISDELAKRAKSWDKSMWIEFSKIYSDSTSCRKVIFYSLISGKLKYNDICISVDKLKLKDIKKYRHYINKFKPNKAKQFISNFKSLRTRLDNFINKDLKHQFKNNKELINTVTNYYANLFAIIEEHLEEPEDTEEELIEIKKPDEVIIQKVKETTQDDWEQLVEKYISSDIYKLYEAGELEKINWRNPYYAVIFLGLDIFNLPDENEYRKQFRELVLIFHPDMRDENHKATANLLLVILNDINSHIWGNNGENYSTFLNSIKFSLMHLGV